VSWSPALKRPRERRILAQLSFNTLPLSPRSLATREFHFHFWPEADGSFWRPKRDSGHLASDALSLVNSLCLSRSCREARRPLPTISIRSHSDGSVLIRSRCLITRCLLPPQMRRLSSAFCRCRRRVPSVSDFLCLSAAAFRICSKRFASASASDVCGAVFFSKEVNIVLLLWMIVGSASAFTEAPVSVEPLRRRERWRNLEDRACRDWSVRAWLPTHQLPRTAASCNCRSRLSTPHV
jgi:hypothetical protein